MTWTKRLAPLVAPLALAAILWAANSIEPPTTCTETVGDFRDTDTADPCAISDLTSVDGTGDTWATSTWDSDFMCCFTNDAATNTITFDFDTPANAPSSTTDAQQIRIAYRKGRGVDCGEVTNKAEPFFSLRVYDGSSEDTLVASEEVSSGVILTAAHNWTYQGGSDGSEVYVEFDDEGNGSTATNARSVMIEYIDWYMDYSATADDLMVVDNREVIRVYAR